MTNGDVKQQRRPSDLVPPPCSEKEVGLTRDINDVSKLGMLFAREPIAPRLGVDHPFPPYLEYAYPPPDGNILTNIVNALIAVPRFYTQVLHLMNKMNIPAPFRMALPTPPLPPPPLPPPQPAPEPPPPPVPSAAAEPSLSDLSSSESEMASSSEEYDAKTSFDDSSTSIKPRRKRVRHKLFLGPAAGKDVANETIGVKSASLVPKEIPSIKKNPVLQIKISSKVSLKDGKDDEIAKEAEDDDSGTHNQFATPNDIESNKLALEEILSLPKFKNYIVGNPTPVLYIKNLGKDVAADDFFYIFGSLFPSSDASKVGLSVKLMQEGRMRGQAFITFPSVQLAHQALNLANGYVFKGKPMIIQFGRNPSAPNSS